MATLNLERLTLENMAMNIGAQILFLGKDGWHLTTIEGVTPSGVRVNFSALGNFLQLQTRKNVYILPS